MHFGRVISKNEGDKVSKYRGNQGFLKKWEWGTYLGGHCVFLSNQPLFIMQPLVIPELIASTAAAEICEFV